MALMAQRRERRFKHLAHFRHLVNKRRPNDRPAVRFPVIEQGAPSIVTGTGDWQSEEMSHSARVWPVWTRPRP